MLAMGSVIYKKICYKLQVRDRTLIDRFDPKDSIIKDDSVQMQLMQICDHCNGQLIEPKLKKAIMKEKLDEDTELVSKPSCPFCGIELKEVPPLKIIHGRASRTFRTDRPARHREFDVSFLSA